MRSLRPPSIRPSSEASVSTCAPKPPTAASSIVTATSCVDSRVRIIRSSSGLAKRMSATVAERPIASSWAAALVASSSRVPSERIATWRPSRTMRPRPISSSSGFAGRSTPVPLPRGVSHRDRPGIVLRHGVDHVRELGLISCRHHHEIGERAEIGEVERSGMRRAVRADQAGPVHRKAHRQVLDRDVVDHLVVGALEEG